MISGAAHSTHTRRPVAALLRRVIHWSKTLPLPSRSTRAVVCLVVGYLVQQWLSLEGWCGMLVLALLGLFVSFGRFPAERLRPWQVFLWQRHGAEVPGMQVPGTKVSRPEVEAEAVGREAIPVEAVRRPWRAMGVILVLIALGGLWSQWRAPGQEAIWSRLIPVDADQVQVVRVRGTVTSVAPTPAPPSADIFESFQFSVAKFKFILRVEAYEMAEGWRPLSGRLECTLERDLPIDETGVAQADRTSELPPPVTVGQRVEVLGRISLATPAKNPRQLDQRRFLWLAGLDAQLLTNQPGQIVVTQADPDWTSLGDRVRDYFKVQLRQHLSDEQYPMAAAILLGDRSLLVSDTRQQYAATGTVHVLAISGLHLGILAGAILWWSRWSFVPQRPILLATIALVLFYTWLVEFRPPIVRAAVLTTILCTATLLGRRAFSLNSLAVALAVVFVLQPHQLSEAGTQLSFLAVAGIVVFVQHRARQVPTPVQELRESRYSPVRRTGVQLWRSVQEVYLCGLAVFVAGLPLVIHYFNLVAWIGLLINPVVILPMTLALLSGFGVLVVAPFSATLANGLGWICGGSLNVMNGIVESAYHLPGSYVWVTSPGWVWIVVWYGWWLLILWDARIPRWAGWLGCLILCLAAYLFPWPRCPDRLAVDLPNGPLLTLTFVDVGHGGSVIIRTPRNQIVVFDAGSFPSARVAGQRIGGVLLAHGIQRIDQLVVSHADLDHYNGVPHLVRRFSVRQFVSAPAMLGDDSPYVQLLGKYLADEKTASREIHAGQTLWAEPGLLIRVVSPPPALFADGDNSNSLVLVVEYGGRRILLTADVEGDGLAALLGNEAGEFDVIQVPHHGSRQSQPVAVAQWAKAEHAILSGQQSRISQETIQAYEEAGSQAWITDEQGAIVVGIHESGQLAIRSFLHDPWPVR